ncbi:hypothetical protein Lal_00049906 [Lupinus albus]|nr:hypothetical protein Lal_00049906 [Lupinus albus]
MEWSRLGWFGHVWRVESQMKVTPIPRGDGRTRRTIIKTIKKDLVINVILTRTPHTLHSPAYHTLHNSHSTKPYFVLRRTSTW